MTLAPDTLQFLDAVINRVNVGIVVVDRELNVVLWNNFLTNYSQRAAQDVLGKNILEIDEELPKKWLESKINHVFELKNYSFSNWQQKPYLFKFASSRPITGDVDSMRQNCTFIPIKDDAGEVKYVCISITDATDTSIYESMLKDAVNQLRVESTHDTLTGIYNRRHFDTTLSHEWQRASRYGAGLSLLLLDIDHFKKFNDDHGHQLGDRVLRHVAHVIKENIRDPDTLGRYGGEEFAVILPETGIEGARLLAERLRTNIESSSLCVNDTCFKVTVSIGIAQFNDDITTLEAFVDVCDRSLYKAKELGRNQVACEQIGMETGNTKTEDTVEQEKNENVIYITIGHRG